MIGIEHVRITRQRTPDLALAQTAQEVGRAAWLDRFPSRAARLDRMFDPADPTKAPALLGTIHTKREAAGLFRPEGLGRFVGVTAYVGEKAVGYALMLDDVSGSKTALRAKKALGRKPYAWNLQINVLADYQGQGIGVALLSRGYELFDDSQQPTSYVFDENQATLAWFKRLAFSTGDSEPTPKTSYFGDDVEPVEQWRLTAPTVADVVAASIASAAEHKLLEVA